MSDARSRTRARAARASAAPDDRARAIAETLRAGGFTTAGAAGPSHGGRRTLLVVCGACGTEQAQKIQDLAKGRRPRCGVCERIARGEPVTPSPPPKRGPGRPREIEGEQDRITFRAGAGEQAAITRYQREHPDASKADALRAILAEWLGARS